jgi:dTDP-4-amino-4,6-dideoxygalactose transaminase
MATRLGKAVLISEARANAQFPFLDLRAQFGAIRSEVLAAVEAVLESQHFILGPEVERFESEVATIVNCKYAIGCASGSDALLLALMALDVMPGDDVITTPFTFVATAGAIARLGARPVFVDIDPETYNLDPRKLARTITSKTRAVIPVHLFGLPADMCALEKIAEEHKLPVIEDAAQAIGARYGNKSVGTIGNVGCFSFFPSKNLGGAGDGGLLTTDDTKLAERLKLLRVHGSSQKYRYEIIGVNSRLDALQAAILRVKLRRLDQWTEARRQNARRYQQLFRKTGLTKYISTPVEPLGSGHVYNQFVIRAAQRDELCKHLKNEGIPTEIYYPSPLHLQPAFAYLGYKCGDFPESEKASSEVLALPIYPELAGEQQAAVVQAIAEFYRN